MTEQWKVASHAQPAPQMSPAPTIGLARARRFRVPLASAAHPELDALDAPGVCRALLIR